MPPDRADTLRLVPVQETNGLVQIQVSLDGPKHLLTWEAALRLSEELRDVAQFVRETS